MHATHVVREAPPARVFTEVYADDAAFRAEEAPHVIDVHRRKDPLLAQPPRGELLATGPAR